MELFEVEWRHKGASSRATACGRPNHERSFMYHRQYHFATTRKTSEHSKHSHPPVTAKVHKKLSAGFVRLSSDYPNSGRAVLNGVSKTERLLIFRFLLLYKLVTEVPILALGLDWVRVHKLRSNTSCGTYPNTTWSNHRIGRGSNGLANYNPFTKRTTCIPVFVGTYQLRPLLDDPPYLCSRHPMFVFPSELVTVAHRSTCER